MQRVREYFYGTARSELAPYSTVVPFSEIAVRRIGESSPGAASGVGGMLAAPSSTLPLGMEVREQSEAEKLALLQIQPGDILLHSILAISHADVPLPNANSSQSDETVKVLETNVAGFVYVARVEEKRKRMFVLAPMPGKLPGRYLWLGTLRWAEM
jgi:polyribonucleotide 5'-hydroxyl-kinase